MLAGILRSCEGWHITRLEEAFRRRGVEVKKFSITDLSLSIGAAPRVSCAGLDMETLDAIITRVIPLGSMEQLMFRMNTLRRLERLGTRIYNSPEAIEKTVDKSYTSHLLADAGLNTPRTIVCERFGDAMAAFETMGDVMVKPISGSCGAGITRISDKDLAYRVFRTMEMNRFVYYIQEYIENDGSDIRVFTLNGAVIGAMKRTGAGWKNNFSRGAQVAPVTVTNDQERMASDAASTLGLDYAGVDLVVSSDGKDYIMEVNGIPGWRGLQQVSDTPIADKLVEFVINETAKTTENS